MVFESAPFSCSEEADDVAGPSSNITSNILNGCSRSPEQTQLVNTFPWILEFIKLARTDIGVTTLRSLERLMRFYQKQAYASVKECYSRPNRATKLKRVMSDALQFFHMTYTDLKLPLEHSSYLAKMSDLMAMYMDMEIKASRTGTESLPKIASKLTSSMHVYFGRSQDHILDTILKSKIITKNFWEISDLIFRRILRDSPGTSVYIMSYIRHLLAFKMWKGIMKGAEERRKISKLAELKLQPPPGFREKMMSPMLRDLLPRLPKARNDITAFYMQAKFPVRDKAKMFLKAVADPRLQCALDRQSFCASDVISYEQDESESNALMNNILSSMNNETGIRDSLRINGIEHKKHHKLKHNAKVKSEQMKKRRRKIDIPVEEIGEDDIPNNIISQTVKNIKIEIPDEASTELPGVASVELSDKVIDEVFDTDNLNIEVGEEIELAPDFPNESYSGSVKEEPVINEDNAQVFLNSKVKDWNVENRESYSKGGQQGSVSSIHKTEETLLISEDQSSIFQGQSEQANFSTLVKAPISMEEGNENDIDDLYVGNMEVVETVQGVSEEMNIRDQVNKSIDTLSSDESEADKFITKSFSISTDHKREESGVGLLHDYTIRSDSKMYEFQMKVYSYSTKLTARTWINLLSPLFCEQYRLKMYRCWCVGCKNNLTVIRQNWKSVVACIMMNSEKSDEDLRGTDENGYSYEDSLEDLKAVAEGEKGDVIYWETEIETLLKKLDEFAKEDCESSSLPLKKRKAFSYNNYVKMAEKSASDVSYPCTPMISIAEIESLKEKLRLNAMAASETVPARRVNYIANVPTNPADTSDPKYNSESVHSSAKPVVPEKSLVPGVHKKTYLPANEVLEQKVKFKTPAQLKDFQHLSAAQDLINFAHSSRAYCEKREPPPPPPPPPKRQSQQKSKSQSRKRKRT